MSEEGKNSARASDKKRVADGKRDSESLVEHDLSARSNTGYMRRIGTCTVAKDHYYHELLVALSLSHEFLLASRRKVWGLCMYVRIHKRSCDPPFIQALC